MRSSGDSKNTESVFYLSIREHIGENKIKINPNQLRNPSTRFLKIQLITGTDRRTTYPY